MSEKNDLMYGRNTQLAVGKLVLTNQGLMEMPTGPVSRVMVGGTVIADLDFPEKLESTGAYELWECMVHAEPRQRFSGGFEGYRIDQIVCDNFGNPAQWDQELAPHPISA